MSCDTLHKVLLERYNANKKSHKSAMNHVSLGSLQVTLTLAHRRERGYGDIMDKFGREKTQEMFRVTG